MNHFQHSLTSQYYKLIPTFSHPFKMAIDMDDNSSVVAISDRCTFVRMHLYCFKYVADLCKWDGDTGGVHRSSTYVSMCTATRLNIAHGRTVLPWCSVFTNLWLCECTMSTSWTVHQPQIRDDSFGTRSKKMRISRRLFITFWTCIYDYIPCFMRSMSILEEMLEMFATTVQA